MLDRLSKGNLRHLGRNQIIGSLEPGARLCIGDRQMVSTGLMLSLMRVNTLIALYLSRLSLVTFIMCLSQFIEH